MWCRTPTSSSIAKTITHRFGILDADALQEDDRAEDANFASVPDHGQRERSAQASKPEKNIRTKIRPRKKAKAKTVAGQGSAAVAQTCNEVPFDKEGARRRARALKKDYPGIKDVPSFVTKSKRKLLIASYQAIHTDTQQDGPEMQPRSQHP